jgi:hypothetical protein
MQPTKRSPTCSRQLLSIIPLGKNLHKVKKEKLPHVKSTGQQTIPSNHPLIIHIIFQTKLQTIRWSRIFFMLIKKKDNTRSNRVILPLASCAYPVPKQSSSMQAGRLELVFLPQASKKSFDSNSFPSTSLSHLLVAGKTLKIVMSSTCSGNPCFTADRSLATAPGLTRKGKG